MDPEAASLPHDAAADNHHSKHHLQPPPLPPQQAASSSTPAAATSLPRRLASAGNGGSGSERPRSFLGFKLSRRSTFVSPASHPIPSVEVTTTSPGPSPLTSLPSLTSSSSALSSPSVDDATDRSSVHSADDYRRRSLVPPALRLALWWHRAPPLVARLLPPLRPPRRRSRLGRPAPSPRPPRCRPPPRCVPSQTRTLCPLPPPPPPPPRRRKSQSRPSSPRSGFSPSSARFPTNTIAPNRLDPSAFRSSKRLQRTRVAEGPPGARPLLPAAAQCPRRRQM
ncbi:hypothetical protein DFJ73DRAFT_116726 [Zopfochytrium polystomum]|nr:hypothetical protein DFJ73DRAFT_116726 [Zopfochytrium polystomum]